MNKNTTFPNFQMTGSTHLVVDNWQFPTLSSFQRLKYGKVETWRSSWSTLWKNTTIHNEIQWMKIFASVRQMPLKNLVRNSWFKQICVKYNKDMLQLGFWEDRDKNFCFDETSPCESKMADRRACSVQGSAAGQGRHWLFVPIHRVDSLECLDDQIPALYFL